MPISGACMKSCQPFCSQRQGSLMDKDRISTWEAIVVVMSGNSEEASVISSLLHYSDRAGRLQIMAMTSYCFRVAARRTVTVSPARAFSSALPSGAEGVTTTISHPPDTVFNPPAAEIGRAHVLNSSHSQISYAVFCLKKKKK